MHGASEQCMQATEIDFSAPTTPSLIVTTRRRFTPHGTSFSFLHAVTQPLHSMQRSASHRNFILAMTFSLYLPDFAERRLRFLHHRHAVIAVGRGRIHRLAAHDRRGPLGVVRQHVLALPPSREVERDEAGVGTDALGDLRLHLDLHVAAAGVLARGADPDEFTVADAAVRSIRDGEFVWVST